MCVLAGNAASGLISKFSIDLASNIPLLKAIVNYQKKNDKESFQRVQKVLQSITNEYTKILENLNGTKTYLAIFDSDIKLIWFTGPEKLKKYISSIYADVDYSIPGQSIGSVFKQFEDGFQLQGGWCGGFPIYKGGRPSFTFASCLALPYKKPGHDPENPL